MSVYTGLKLLNYTLTRPLGEGGFGVVYEAVHEELGKRAAVKILHPAFARHDEVVGRFLREARAACSIGHPAIIDITNVGRLDTGEPYIMMEYVAGQSLSGLIERTGPLSPEAVATIFGAVAGALAAAHAKGIVHRDLKPDNIMVLERDGTITGVKLLDFGIAKLLESKGDVSTVGGAVMGTPNFMAPEQATDAKRVDARADVYGFAATLFTALTGRPPFDAETTTGLLIKVATEPAPRLRAFRPELPAELDDAIARCLEKAPGARPSDVGLAWSELATALGASASAPALPVAAGASASAHQTTLSTAGGQVQPRSSSRTRRLGIVLAAAGIAAVIVAGLVMLGGGGGDPDADDAEALPETAVLAGALDGAPGDADAAADAASFAAAIDAASSDATIADAAEPPPRRPVDGGVRRPRPPIDAPVAVVAPPRPPPPPPALECSKASFSAVYRARSPSKTAAKAALDRLRACEEAGAISASEARSARIALAAIAIAE